MRWKMKEEKAFPDKSLGRVRMRLKFAWLPIQIEDRKIWWEYYVLIEEWTYMTSDVFGNYEWYPINKFLRWDADKVRAFVDKFGIKEGVQLAGKGNILDYPEYAKVYNHIHLGKGPLMKRSGEPEIRWYKVDAAANGDPMYLSRLMEKS